MPIPTSDHISVLGTQWAGEEWTELKGFWRPHEVCHTIRFLDWTVDGSPLRNLIRFVDGSVPSEPSFLDTQFRSGPQPGASLRALLGKGDPTAEDPICFSDGRVALLRCWCGDIFDRSVSADIRFTDSLVRWNEIALQDEPNVWTGPDGVEPFSLTFARDQYESTVNALLHDWN